MSTRTGALLAAAFANARDRELADASNSSSDGRTNTMSSGRLSPYHWQPLPRTATGDSNRQIPSRLTERSTETFATARSTFAHLQTEGEALLGGHRPPVDRDDPYQRALAAHQDPRYPYSYTYDPAPSPNVPTRRRQGLFGSLRRALTGMSVSDRSFSFTTTTGGYEDEPGTRASSPTKHRKTGSASGVGVVSGRHPRRALSDGGALLLRSKRGQKDWDEIAGGFAPYRDDPTLTGDWGEALEPRVLVPPEEWDVEDAANRRDFQVMFSVPKARLRVVNADMDRASLRSVSDGVLSRAGSLKGLGREGSVVRRKEEAEVLKGGKGLAAMAEESADTTIEEKAKGS